MTDEEKIAMVKALSDEEDAGVISAFLTMVGKEIYRLADPGKTSTEEEILEENAVAQIHAAAYYLNKRGWDYQTSYSENGVSRSYETGGLPDSVLRMITTKCW